MGQILNKAKDGTTEGPTPSPLFHDAKIWFHGEIMMLKNCANVGLANDYKDNEGGDNHHKAIQCLLSDFHLSHLINNDIWSNH